MHNFTVKPQCSNLVGWLCWCFTALQHILGHFRRSQLTYPHCSWASLLGSLPVLSAHSFASNWQLSFLNQRKRENGCRNFFHDQISKKESGWTGAKTSDPLIHNQTRSRLRYAARQFEKNYSIFRASSFFFAFVLYLQFWWELVRWGHSWTSQIVSPYLNSESEAVTWANQSNHKQRWRLIIWWFYVLFNRISVISGCILKELCNETMIQVRRKSCLQRDSNLHLHDPEFLLLCQTGQFFSKWALSSKNVSSGVCDQLRFKPACSATATS